MADLLLKKAYYEKLELIRKSNPKIQEAYNHFDYMGLVTEEEVAKFLNNHTLNPEEFIHFIALRRKHGDGEDTGGAIEAALQDIIEDYRNTPWKFVEEFLQNADDCSYKENPEIEITVDSKKKTIEFVYNEIGFTEKDIWALTQFRKSNKVEKDDYSVSPNAEGLFFNEKTGRKGIGFKSVFALPAENVIVHIKSNGYSFMLNKSINPIVPIWEDGFIDDGKTHITVELENPSYGFRLEEIYPNLKEQFSIDQTNELFSKSPILFMHRLREIKVNNILTFKKEYFEISVKEKMDTFQYGNLEKDYGNVLSAVCHNGKICTSLWCEIDIQIKDSNGLKLNIPTLRYSESRKINNNWRLFSILVPILDKELKWNKGSLFRTFPVEYHQYNIPLAMDIPFELDSSRKSVSYSLDKKDFNNSIYKHAYNLKDSVLTHFFEKLRTKKNINMDMYFCLQGAELFAMPENKYNNQRVLPVFNLEDFIEEQEIFPSFNNDKFLSYKKLICVDSDLLYWPDHEYLLSLLLEEKRGQLVSKEYMNSLLLQKKRNSVINQQFVESINRYLDKEESKFGLENSNFKNILENNLYPFLIKNNNQASRIGAYRNLKIYCFKYIQNGCVVLKREKYNSDQVWLENTNKNSINQYRTLASSIVSLKAIESQIRKDFNIHSVREEFTTLKINSFTSTINSWKDLNKYLETILYYEYSLDSIKIPFLDSCVVSEKIDTIYNPFRNSKRIYEIPTSDVTNLAKVKNVKVSEIVKLLKSVGLRNEKDFFDPQGGFLSLKDITIDLLNDLHGDDLEKCLNSLEIELEKKGKKLDVNYQTISSGDLELLVFFLKQKQLIATESYFDICDQCLSDVSIWKKETNVAAEILLRAVNRAHNQNFVKEYVSKIDLDYLISHKLVSLYVKAIEDRGFVNNISIKNNNGFKKILPLEILSTIDLFFPESKEKIEGYSFYCGDLKVKEYSKETYLEDGVNKIIYLHQNDSFEYRDALSHFFKRDYDPKVSKYADELSKRCSKLLKEIIEPALIANEHDYDRAFNEIEDRFEELSKEEVINIISWFRYHSYDKALGGATRSHEKEIEDDYESAPWHFVYEFMQNVDDCLFAQNVKPDLSIEVNKRLNCITFKYNEKGFTINDIKALTSFGLSDKSYFLEKNTTVSGIFDLEKTGRKGRGFKSVFALPGDDIVVHISSNGYTFKISKRFGQIIPIWEDSKYSNTNGTVITVEGLKGNSINGIYDKFLESICANDRENFFAKSPLLYLRKIKHLKISNGSERFEVGFNQVEESFSNETFAIGNLKLISGIINKGKYHKSHLSIFNMFISHTGNSDINIKGIRLSMMEKIRGEVRLISVIAPIIHENEQMQFKKGALYRTLPLNENEFDIPLAINAPYEVNTGRSSIQNTYNEKNNYINSLVFGEVFSTFYKYIRDIDNISIENYIFKKDTYEARLFSNLNYVETVNLEYITRSQPVLKLFNGNGYVSCNDARILSHSFYRWYDPSKIGKIFSKGESDVLVEEKYTSRILGVKRIDLINSSFHENINKYLEYCERTNSEQLWKIVQNDILPLIHSNYLNLFNAYLVEGKKDLLREMRIFSYTTYDRKSFLVSGNENVVWMSNCPKRYYSFDQYRVLKTAPIKYSSEMFIWMKELITIQEFSEVFNKDNFKEKNIKTWEDLVKWIKIFLYYDVKPEFKISYLSKCTLSKSLSLEKNLFRNAFSLLKDRVILDHCIEKEDIESIILSLKGYKDITSDEIISLLKNLGLKRADDYFEIDRGVLRLKSETIDLLNKYCTNIERSNECIDSLEKKYNELKNNKKFTDVHITYSDLHKCKPLFLTQLLKRRFLYRETAEKIAEGIYEFYPFINNTDYSELILVSLSHLTKRNPKRHDIKITLSDIISRKIGSYVKDAVSHGFGTNLTLHILRDIKNYPYESKEVKKSLSWLQSSGSKALQDIEKYEYYTADVKSCFDQKDTSYFLYDSESVILDRDDTNHNLLEFVRNRYSKDTNGEVLSALIQIVSIQNELTGTWKKSKKEYIETLHSFREKTHEYITVLCPDYQKNINQATGNMEEFMIPELLQNINDCKKNKDEVRDLHITIEGQTMVLQYAEHGFEYSDVYSITAYGQSTKHDEREGEKGLGFKKVFAVFSSVEIYSNGFNFSLSDKKVTIPSWIEEKAKIEKYNKDGYTTMVFRLSKSNVSTLNKISNIWENAISKPEEAGILLALKNIDQYDYINTSKEYHLSREQMLDHYYHAEVPLLPVYKKLLEHSFNESIVEKRMFEVKRELRRRKKCSLMSEEEFEKYIFNLNLGIYIPKKGDMSLKGNVYSTLPTTKELGAAFYINLPLELSTGRNEILENSTFNSTVWRMVFDSDGAAFSVMNFAFSHIAAACKQLDLYKYFNEDVSSYIRFISKGKEEYFAKYRKELDCIPIFRAYPDGNTVPLSNAYTVEKIIYDYSNSKAKKKVPFDQWINQNYEQYKGKKLLLLREYSVQEIQKINNFANSIGENKNRFPLSVENDYLTIKYFEEEYGEGDK